VPANKVLLKRYVMAGESLHVTLQLLGTAATQKRRRTLAVAAAAAAAAVALHRQKLQELCAALQSIITRYSSTRHAKDASSPSTSPSLKPPIAVIPSPAV
jgi:hypothetical protein